MIVWCCGMSRSGGTAEYQIVKGLVERAGLGEGVGLQWQPYVPPEQPPSRWVVIKREQSTPARVIQRASDKRHSRVVGIYRDARAVAASLLTWRTAQGRNPSPSDAWQETVLALRWYRAWTPHLDYEVAYETAVQDWGAVAIGINEALGLDLPAKDCRDVAARWSVKENRVRLDRQKVWFDAKTLLTQTHITGGGDRWADVLPVSVLAYVEGYYGDWMREHGYDCVLGGPPQKIYRRSQIVGPKPGET